MNVRVLPALLLWLAAVAQAGAVEAIGHRGRTAPTQVENSLRRFQATAAAGFGVELDLRRSRDGTLWVLHDATLDRSTSGRGAIAGRGDAALARVRLRAPDGSLTDEPLPRFDAVAAWAARTPRVRLLLDLKGATAAEVRLLLQCHGSPAAPSPAPGTAPCPDLTARAILLTFDRAQAEEALRNGGGATVSVLVTRAQDIADYRRLATGRPLALYLPQRSAPALFQAAHASGLEVISDALPVDPGESVDAQAVREGCTAYATFLATHPADVLVSDTPGCVAAGLGRH